MTTPLQQLQSRFRIALVDVLGDQVALPDVVVGPASQPQFGDYQSNVCLVLGKAVKQNPRALAQSLIEKLDLADICEPPEIAGPGFINLRLLPSYLAREITPKLGDQRLGVAPVISPLKVVVDFSSPNIAKEMHVGHLRSTIIGDAIARILEFQGHDVLRLNHVGDWGTQFGMLITHLRTAYPDALTTPDALDLGDLVSFYKQAKQRFDLEPAFQIAAREEVVKLQQGDTTSRQAWELLCQQSRREFQKIYDLLDIRLTERGESFYNPLLASVVADLKTQGLLVEDQGAQCVFLEGFTNKEGDPQPLIIQKSDGGFNYATTDLAAIRYRVTQDQAQWLIYVTDAGQSTHFAQVFQVARRAGWLPPTVKVEHIPFGLVLGAEGKRLKTRSGDTIRLQELLDEAIERAKTDLRSRLDIEGRQESPDFIEEVAQVIGLGAVKYADLSQNRNSNYVFSFDKMLSLQGNTAPYLIYAYVRIQGIIRKGEINFATLAPHLELCLGDDTELALAKHLLQFADILSLVTQELLPNRLCQYLFELSQKFNQFYDRCPVLNSPEPERTSRLALCQLTAQTLKLGLGLLELKIIDRM
ncbi:arginine--tRNA ligase [Synechococcus sp. PCC 6312]|uniref:arginine--tRNA ligase n=1 Tax=Synechococcus sp. (strain ATCC 27167 / PCC 6312) TaxID=195253 RepID=UPI00029EFF4E|nr:arginine--tRNA ligase [Synechococcus sp. PCC 6312]AFY61591.1 arginyl-tRNA synthetase [Synechococcus sp. PCC 6312]